MGAQPRTSMGGGGTERQRQQEEEFTWNGESTRENGGATCNLFLEFSLIESSNVGYLSQGPRNLSPISDPTNNLEQLIPPDPAPKT